MSLDFAPVFADFDALVRGAVVTVEVTAGALLLGCVIGLLVGVGRLNPQRSIIYNLCSVYLLFFRGTPLLVQLFIWFFGLPQFGVTLPAFACGVLGLGMYSGAYVSEIVRGAIQSVDREMCIRDRGRTVAARLRPGRRRATSPGSPAGGPWRCSSRPGGRRRRSGR